MLDDLKLIHERDAQDALGIAEKQWQQLEYNFSLPAINVAFENIVYSGMGGSALGALISTSWPGYKVPFEIVRNYTIPAYVSDKTFFIAASYSGNTEETLSAIAEAEKQGAHIAVITGGGQLLELAKTKGYPVAVLPDVGQPRYAVLASMKALLTLLEHIGAIDTDQTEKSLKDTASFLKTTLAQWRPDIPTKDNYAKQIALELMGKSIVVYAGPLLYPAAYKWKISFNENAKHLAWVNQFPEFNHNEFSGWTKQPVEKPYAVIDLRSDLEHPRIQKRFEVTERLLSGMRPAPQVVHIQGDNLFDQLVWTTALGDFVSLYLAILNGINPTPVELIEKFKQTMNA